MKIVYTSFGVITVIVDSLNEYVTIYSIFTPVVSNSTSSLEDEDDDNNLLLRPSLIDVIFTCAVPVLSFDAADDKLDSNSFTASSLPCRSEALHPCNTWPHSTCTNVTVPAVGANVGAATLGLNVGLTVGFRDGTSDGNALGTTDGVTVGAALGS